LPGEGGGVTKLGDVSLQLELENFRGVELDSNRRHYPVIEAPRMRYRPVVQKGAVRKEDLVGRDSRTIEEAIVETTVRRLFRFVPMRVQKATNRAHKHGRRGTGGEGTFGGQIDYVMRTFPRIGSAEDDGDSSEAGAHKLQKIAHAQHLKQPIVVAMTSPSTWPTMH
jgi:hypothetical protein